MPIEEATTHKMRSWARHDRLQELIDQWMQDPDVDYVGVFQSDSGHRIFQPHHLDKIHLGFICFPDSATGPEVNHFLVARYRVKGSGNRSLRQRLAV
jgi:hypothetical protein